MAFNLPGEEAEDHGVERDVRGARVGVALLLTPKQTC
jgi:hypothetical protein